MRRLLSGLLACAAVAPSPATAAFIVETPAAKAGPAGGALAGAAAPAVSVVPTFSAGLSLSPAASAGPAVLSAAAPSVAPLPAVLPAAAFPVPAAAPGIRARGAGRAVPAAAAVLPAGHGPQDASSETRASEAERLFDGAQTRVPAADDAAAAAGAEPAPPASYGETIARAAGGDKDAQVSLRGALKAKPNLTPFTELVEALASPDDGVFRYAAKVLKGRTALPTEVQLALIGLPLAPGARGLDAVSSILLKQNTLTGQVTDTIAQRLTASPQQGEFYLKFVNARFGPAQNHYGGEAPDSIVTALVEMMDSPDKTLSVQAAKTLKVFAKKHLPSTAQSDLLARHGPDASPDEWAATSYILSRQRELAGPVWGRILAGLGAPATQLGYLSFLKERVEALPPRRDSTEPYFPEPLSNALARLVGDVDADLSAGAEAVLHKVVPVMPSSEQAQSDLLALGNADSAAWPRIAPLLARQQSLSAGVWAAITAGLASPAEAPRYAALLAERSVLVADTPDDVLTHLARFAAGVEPGPAKSAMEALSLISRRLPDAAQTLLFGLRRQPSSPLWREASETLAKQVGLAVDLWQDALLDLSAGGAPAAASADFLVAARVAPMPGPVLDALLQTILAEPDAGRRRKLLQSLEHRLTLDRLFRLVYPERAAQIPVLMPGAAGMNAKGFFESPFRSEVAVAELLDTLRLERAAAGVTAYELRWRGFRKIADIGARIVVAPPRREYRADAMMGEYLLPYPVRLSGATVVEEPAVFADYRPGSPSGPEVRRAFESFDALIEANFRALAILAQGGGTLTRRSAGLLLDELGVMVDKLGDFSKDASEERQVYERLRRELEARWADVPETAALPAELARRVAQHEGEVPDPRKIQNVHTLVNVVHQHGIAALMSKARRSGGDGSVKFDGGRKISLLNLGDPLVRNGRPVNPLFALLLQARGDSGAEAIFKDDELWSHLALGCHSAEVYVKYAAPDDGGMLRIRYSDSYRNHKGSNARLEYIRRAMEALGLSAKITGMYLEASWDKDTGLASRDQLAEAFTRTLTLLLNTRDYDLAFNTYPETLRDSLLAEMPVAFMAEGVIPIKDSAIKKDMEEWQKDAPRRERMRKLLDGELRRLELPAIPADAPMGQATIDAFFTRPVRLGLAGGEFVIDGEGVPQRSGVSPVEGLAAAALIHEEKALALGAALRGVDSLELTFERIGTVGRLRAERAQRVMNDGEVLTVFALRDPDTAAIAHATAGIWDGRAASALDARGLAEVFAREGVVLPEPVAAGRIQRGAWTRMLRARPEAAAAGAARGLAASSGAGPAYGRVVFDRTKARKGWILVVPFTAPDDIEAMRRSAAVVTTGGGLLSHAAITTRELGVASVILNEARWSTDADGNPVLDIPLDGPLRPRAGPGGLLIADAGRRAFAVVREGDPVFVDGARGTVAPVGRGDREALLALSRERRAARSPLDFVRGMESRIGKASAAAADRMIGLVIEEILSGPEFRSPLRLQEDLLHELADSLDDAAFARQQRTLASWIAARLGSIEFDLEGERPDTSRLSSIDGLWTLARAFQLPSDGLASAKSRASRLLDAENARASARKARAMEEVFGLAAREVTLVESDLPRMRRALREVWPKRGSGARRRLLFVCTGNTCRSPIAEHLAKSRLARRELADVEVASRGIGGHGLPITEAARRALAEKDVDAGAHEARPLRAADVEGADLILPMQQSQSRMIAAQFPGAGGKVFTLKSYAGQGDVDVRDPFGAGFSVDRETGGDPLAVDREAEAQAYRRTADEIDAALEPILAREAALQTVDRREQELTAVKRRRLDGAKPSVLPFGAIDDDFVPLTGGKAAKLGEILGVVKGLGYVPEGAALTTEAYLRFLREAGIEAAVLKEARTIDAYLKAADLGSARTQRWVHAHAEKIQGLIRSKSLDARSPLGRELLQALSAHGMGAGPFAVRSSAVQEDGAEAAFAGAAETALFVQPDEVLAKIVDVWASFWLARGILYRKQHGVTSVELKPAVAVQRMVRSEAAGVMFTVNPATGRRETIINAAFGQGEGVVSGLVQADQYAADPTGEEVRVPVIGDKRVSVERKADGRGTEIKTVPPSLRKRRALTPDQVGRLARIGAALEAHFGYPVDVEFAVENDRIAVLQVRPVTTSAR